MRKFYVLLLLALGVAGMSMAQDTAGGDSTNVIAVESVVINNWDGTPKSPNLPLYIGVDEIQILNLTVEPEDADLETIHLGIVMEEGDMEDSPIAFWGMEIAAYRAATRTLLIYDQDNNVLASTQITAYDTSGSMESDTTINWTLETDWETGEIQLVLTKDPSSADPSVLPDRDKDTKYPWDEMGYNIDKLEIEGNYSYIGEGVFDQLYNLYNIQFTGDNQSVESIHYKAFSEEIHPWRFAFGDPQNGPLVPPQVIFDQGMSAQEGLEVWQHMFSEETVLYVPDEMTTYQGRPIRSVELYRTDEIWGNAFARIDDHTVEVATVTDKSVVLKWMPQEGATTYVLRIRKLGCENCDTTVYIQADGYQGLIEPWYQDQPAPALRAPKSDDGGGGMTLTILIGGGGFHTDDISAEVTDMESAADYDYSRDVYTQEGIEEALSKTGTIETNNEGFEEVWVQSEKKAYDLLGRPMGVSLEDLPAGMYIWDDGTKRTTILINK